jgi:hypothetical protein
MIVLLIAIVVTLIRGDEHHHHHHHHGDDDDDECHRGALIRQWADSVANANVGGVVGSKTFVACCSVKIVWVVDCNRCVFVTQITFSLTCCVLLLR